MIHANFFRRSSDGSIHMQLMGHAGAAGKGEDLVCAAATMLVYTAAQAVQFLYEQGKLKRKPKISIQNGDAVIIATPKKETEAETALVFWVAQAGAHVLGRSYPENVSVTPMRMGAIPG